MQTVGSSSTGSNKSLKANNTSHFADCFKIKHVVVGEDPIIWRNCLKKNYRPYRIEATASLSRRLVRGIIKTNSKHLKVAQPYWKCPEKDINSLKQAKSLKQLVLPSIQGIQSIYSQSKKPNAQKLCRYLSFLKTFPKLKDLKLMFPKNRDKSYQKEFLHQTLNNLKLLLKVTSLHVQVDVNNTSNNFFRKKAYTMRGLKKIKSLSLSLDFNNVWNPTRDLFTQLPSLPELEHLNINISNCFVLNPFDFIRFIASLTNLKTLNIQFCKLVFSKYEQLLEEIQKLEKLESLSITQEPAFPSHFSYKFVNETILHLKNLNKIYIGIGTYIYNYQEVEDYIKVLSNHDALEDINLSFILDNPLELNYESSEDLYNQLNILIEKLKKVKMSLRNFSEDVEEKVSKVLKSKRNDSYLCCTVSTPIVNPSETA